nr:hypothetical protein [Saccharopolyspora sp. ASAGF58]
MADLVDQTPRAPGEQRVHQLVLAPELAVDRSLADPRTASDPLDR